MTGNLPNELTAVPRWTTAGKDKRPFTDMSQPEGMRNAIANPSMRLSYEKALAQKNGGFLGFVFTSDDDLGGVDLDSCIDETGKLTQWAEEIISDFDSYAEVSPSGHGVKIFAKGAPNALPVKKIQMPGEAFNGHFPAIEAYTSNRYFTVTGQKLANCPSEIRSNPEAWQRLIKRLNPKESPQKKSEKADVIEGGRNSHLTSLAGSMRRRGMSHEAILAALLIENDEKCNPPLQEAEVSHIAKSVSGYEPTVNDKDCFKEKDPNVIARAFSQETSGIHHWRSDFYQWDETFWKKTSDEDMASKLGLWLESKRVLNRKGMPIPFGPTGHDVKEVCSALSRIFHISDLKEAPFWIELKQGDPSPLDLVPFQNGVLNLKMFQLQKPDSRLFALHKVDCEFKPDAKSEKWDEFLKQIFPETNDIRIQSIEEIFGYCLTADTTQQKAFLWQGARRSGKGTLGRILRALVGPDRWAAPTISSFANEFGLQQLIAKSVAMIADARGLSKQDPHIVVERILSITGEDSIGVNRKHKSHWDGQLPTRLIYASNVPPKLNDPSGTIVTRFIAIPFTESFEGRENPNLTKELLDELPGIVNRALEGLKRLRKRGHFEQPEMGKELLEQMEENTGPVRNFVQEQCAIGSEFEIECKFIFEKFNQWAVAHGHHKVAVNTFGSDLFALNHGIRKTNRRNGEKRERVYQGITLAEFAEAIKEYGKLSDELKQAWQGNPFERI